ncbi:hypothetical protein OHA40_08425 [Nocardia sp. NBC_00508]|uniref:hypothetical protein n=1 Tax=Nocardia sp. NBC_00508 TaxID=2975992 RepID=UPI002E7FD269|nr:hypothetical protein [Nocardia sp. NBC_00508]WUD68128.1 hypothetical protein OHA40_08425 [Nocardia sp. NBC_00508]
MTRPILTHAVVLDEFVRADFVEDDRVYPALAHGLDGQCRPDAKPLRQPGRR